MAADLFINYFEFAGLDPGRSREDNCKLLNQKLSSMHGMRSAEATRNKEILKAAIAIFNNEERYASYRAEWEQRSQRKPEPARESPRNPVNPEPSADARQKGFGSLVFEALANAARKGLENAAQQQVPQNQARIPANPGIIQLAGRWRENSTGYWMQVQQNGPTIATSVVDSWGNPISQGRGMISGGMIQYTARNMLGQDEEGRLGVSADGTAIQGQISFSVFGMPVDARIVLFVRA
jgi:hypothetical protein